ncbi:MAG: rod shape-determining protein MreD [bacterium]
MRKVSLWLVVLITLLLQVTLFTRIEVGGIGPDPVLIVLVLVALALGPVVGALLGFLIGLAQLAILSTSMVSAPLAATLVGYLVGKYGTKIMYESYLVQFLILFLGVLAYDIVNFTISSPGQLGLVLVRFSLGSALYTAAVGVVLVVFIEKVVGLRLIK